MAPGEDASPAVIPNSIKATPALTDYEQRAIDNALVAEWAIQVRNRAIANSSQAIVDAVESEYADNPRVQNAIILALSSHKLELSGANWNDHWVDHSPNSPKISISSHKWFFQRSPANIAWELQGVVRDDDGFYQEFGLWNSWEGATHRIGFGGLRVIGGGTMTLVGLPMLAAPEPTVTKVGGVMMIVYGGNHVIGGGSSILGRQFSVDPMASAKNVYWDYFGVDDDIRFWGGHIDEVFVEAATIMKFTRVGKLKIFNRAAWARYASQFPMRTSIAAQRAFRAGKSILQLAKQNPIDILNSMRAPRWGVDSTMRAADEAAGVIVNGRYINNPTARNLAGIVTDSGKVGGKQMSGQFMYVVDDAGDIIIGTRARNIANTPMPHPTLVGGANPQVRAAGIVDIRGGRIYLVDNASGHFKPGSGSLGAAEEAFKRLLPDSAFHKNFQGFLPWNR